MPGREERSGLPATTDPRPISSVYNPAVRRRDWPAFTYLYLHRTARNLAVSLAALHARGAVVGGWNEADVRITDTALVHLPAAESGGREAGKPELTAPELQGRAPGEVSRTPEQDLFALGVLVFQLLMEGHHPFAGASTGPAAVPLELAERIAAGYFPYGTGLQPFQPPRTAPPFALLAPGLRALFLACFEDGARDPARRPTALAWETALAAAEEDLATCQVNPQHLYGRHLAACPWCERTVAMGGRDPFPAPAEAAPAAPASPAPPDPDIPYSLPPPPRGLLIGGGLVLALLVAFVYLGTRHSPVRPVFTPQKELVSPTPQVGVREVQAGLSTSHLEGLRTAFDPTGCDEASLTRVRALARLGPVRRGVYALEQPLQRELSNALRGAELNRPCVEAYLDALAEQEPGGWQVSPFRRDGMAKLRDLLAGVGQGGAGSAEAQNLFSQLRPLVCQPGWPCEIQLVGETLVLSSPIEIEMYAHTLMRKTPTESWGANGVHLQLHWVGGTWLPQYVGKSPYRPEYR
jgi:hypothetical protein